MSNLGKRLQSLKVEGEGGVGLGGGEEATRVRLALEVAAAVKEEFGGVYKVVWGGSSGGGGAVIYVEGSEKGSVVGEKAEVAAEIANVVAFKIWEFKKITDLERKVGELTQGVKIFKAVVGSGVDNLLGALRELYGPGVVKLDGGGVGGKKILSWPMRRGGLQEEEEEEGYVGSLGKFVFPSDSPDELAAKQIDDAVTNGMRHSRKLRRLLITLANTDLSRGGFEDAVIQIVRGATGASVHWFDGPRVWGRDQYGRKEVVRVEDDWVEVLGGGGAEAGETVGYVGGEGNREEVALVVGLAWKLCEGAGDRGGAGGGTEGSSGVVEALLKSGAVGGEEIMETLVKVVCEKVTEVYTSRAVTVVLEEQEEEGRGVFLVYKSDGGGIGRVNGFDGFVGDVAECYGGGKEVDGGESFCEPIRGVSGRCVGVVRVKKVVAGELKEVVRVCAEVGVSYGVLIKWISAEGRRGELDDKVVILEEELKVARSERRELMKKAETEEQRSGELEERFNRVNVKFNSVKKSLHRMEFEKDILKKENETMGKFVGAGGGMGMRSGFMMGGGSAMGASLGDSAGSRTPGGRGGRGILKKGSGGGVRFETSGGSGGAGRERIDEEEEEEGRGGGGLDTSFGTLGSLGTLGTFETNISVMSPPRNSGGSRFGDSRGSRGSLGPNSSQKVIDEMRADNVLLSRALKQFLETSGEEGGVGNGGGGDGGLFLDDLAEEGGGGKGGS